MTIEQALNEFLEYTGLPKELIADCKPVKILSVGGNDYKLKTTSIMVKINLGNQYKLIPLLYRPSEGVENK